MINSSKTKTKNKKNFITKYNCGSILVGKKRPVKFCKNGYIHKNGETIYWLINNYNEKNIEKLKCVSALSFCVK